MTIAEIKEYIDKQKTRLEKIEVNLSNRDMRTMLAEIKYMLDQLDEWVSVDDRLPKDNEEVLTQAEDGVYNLFKYTKDLYSIDNYDFADCKNKKVGGFYCYDSEFGYFEVDDIIAWKYIEPYKESE